MTFAERIRTKLQTALAPAALEVIDESDKHRGHAGAQPGGETHFRVEIVADAFDGLSRVARHKKIYALLAEELAERVHALSINAKTSSELARETAQ